jgi:hypothetical protein
VLDEIHPVRGILAIVDRESGIEADLVGMFTSSRADAVKVPAQLSASVMIPALPPRTLQAIRSTRLLSQLVAPKNHGSERAITLE